METAPWALAVSALGYPDHWEVAVAVESVTRDQIIKFLNDRGVKVQCEVCGSDEGWSLPDGELSKIVGLFNPRPDGGYIAPGGIAPVIVLVCNHCTNVRLFSEVLMSRLIGGGARGK